MSEIRLKPINELLSERFFIPAYQRGYRWNKPQVVALLSDLWQFRKNCKEDKEYYCLQPVVVKKRDDETWELVDGQQRLTTIFLIMTALDKQMQLNEKNKFQLKFETRADSEQFLQAVDFDQREENIDYFHICDALDAINEWFEGWNSPDKNDLLSCFIDQTRRNARIIWYELEYEDNPVGAFTRLNVGKIPLTNAELIRALFLCSKNFKGSSTIIQQLKIAQEWDSIEKVLQSPKVWYFLCSGQKEYSSRIEFIFECLAEAENAKLNLGRYSTFYFFNEKINTPNVDVEKEWLTVKQCFMTFEEWYENRILHHLIGYLIEDGVPIGSLLAKGATLPKTEFQKYLKQLIYSRLTGNESFPFDEPNAIKDSVEEFVTDLSYVDDRSKIKALLLLFNVATLLLNAKSSPMFPFDHYKNESWDMEHVHSVSSDMPDDKKRAEYWLADFIEHIGRTGENKELCEKAQSVFDDFDFGQFEKCYEEILKNFQDKDVVDNSVGNLALLNSGTNRSYKNAVFPVKRTKVLASEKEGVFVPVCTKNVFLKCYSKKIGEMFYWSKEDRDCYRESIVETLVKFFTVELKE